MLPKEEEREGKEKKRPIRTSAEEAVVMRNWKCG